MEKQISLLLLFLVVCFLLLNPRWALATGTEDGSEYWGYVEVRPKAHLFWWLYKSPYRVEDPSKPWPTILWLQGGPGGSGVAFGNFMEIGPLDGNLEPRNSTWLHKADLLFVSPLYIFAESYGGKFAATLGLSALKAIEAGELKLQLGGVALGDSWISPQDFVFTWGPLLKDLSRMNNKGLNISNSLALKIRQQLAEGKYEDATNTWGDLQNVILEFSNNVDFYNFLLDGEQQSPVKGRKAMELKRINGDRYSRYLSTKVYKSAGVRARSLYDLMNGPVKDKLKIIPTNVIWGGQNGLVFPAMAGDFMKPRIQEVDELLAKGINLTIYNGQVDLICSTKGAEAWVNKLKWDGLQNFLDLDRTPLYCNNDETTTKGFTSSYRNLYFYWILGAGHFVPVEQPCISLEMVGRVTQSPA
ncbi:hypothetical protein Tsubulata_031909 [Turnera subulata]|uniref:Carboxypeptidase n=1 Tax=Turnera subulata TaxID=218843 RepID=A0A9Q0JDJ5_9ROSI|nr:hypothetical protein Tsubulata_031909 [Turnera subulata]